jgi:hypothetical protein
VVQPLLVVLLASCNAWKNLEAELNYVHVLRCFGSWIPMVGGLSPAESSAVLQSL